MRKIRVTAVIALTVAAAALIGLGLFQLMSVYRKYKSDMLDYESRRLNSVVTSSVGRMDMLLEGYGILSEQMESSQNFAGAEEEYLATRDVTVLEDFFSREDIYYSIPPYLIGAYDENGAFLAATDTEFPQSEGDDERLGAGIWLRRDEKDGFWLVFGDLSQSGFRYEIAISIQAMFSEHASYTSIGELGILFLTDRAGTFFSYGGGEGVVTSGMEAFLESHPAVDAGALAELRESGPTDPGYRILRYPWTARVGEDAAAKDTLTVVCPLTGIADGLILGAAISFQEFDSFLSGALRQVGWVILLEIAGALLLFAMLAWIMVVSRRNALALEATQKKAELMEEIGRQQQALYHGERLQQLGLMTSGVIHEFNNLLTPIMSQTHLLLEQMADQPDSPLFDSALDVLEAEENAREVLRRMSDIGKRHADMEFFVLDLCALLRRTVDLSAMVKKNEIRRELILPDGPLYVEGNDQLLTQAFLNLCINAVQAMGDTGTLTVRAETEERSGRTYAKVEVSDTGPGIPEEMFAKMYEPFITTKGAQGTGLGLAICRKIVESHKGTISAANRPEGGAVFTVRIPICPAPSDAEK